MKIKIRLFSFIRSLRASTGDWLARNLKKTFYLYLAAAFSVIALVDTALFHFTGDMRSEAFDAMVRYRVNPVKPDKDIVIVNIDEASLNAMAKESGRWPWPRQVLGRFIEQVEKQHPKAVVLDIMFSDPDVLNPQSDAYFNNVIAKTDNTFFPMLRMEESHDAQSELMIRQIPGTTPISGEELLPDAKISVVMPYFSSILQSGRLGAQNVVIDSDGVVRSYPVYLAEYGWQLPSLPARMGQSLGWQQPQTQNMLLNWRGMPYSYNYVSFADAYQDLLATDKQRPLDEFKDKIIIIGSTAPNLFNLHATPLDQAYPGVEVLATAIDNYKNSDSFKFPEARYWYLLFTVFIIWVTAWAFYRGKGKEKIDKLFGLSQVLMVVFSFISINFANTYINLVGPLMLGISYFTLARLYAVTTSSAMEQNVVRTSSTTTAELHATLMLIRFDTKLNVISATLLDRLCVGLRKFGAVETSVEVISGTQKGVWELMEKTIAISWLADSADEQAQQDIRDDVERVLEGLAKLLRRNVVHVEGAFSHVVHHANISGGERAEDGWRRLFAEALLKYDK
jgi:CHASE2 domain-containing sensor protein